MLIVGPICSGGLTVFALSYSAYRTYRQDGPRDFYLRYMARHRPPKAPQNKYLACGSATDVCIKRDIIHLLYGAQPAAEFYAKQWERCVESHMRDSVRDDGEYACQQYKKSGAFDALLEEMRRATNIEIEVAREGHINGVPLKCIADISFKIDGVQVVYDLKNRGFYSASTTSPTPGYMLCNNAQHKRFEPMTDAPIRCNRFPMEDFSIEYAEQTSIGAWSLTGKAPEFFIAWIDELVGPRAARVATHRALVGEATQAALFAELRTLSDLSFTWFDPELEKIGAAMCATDKWYSDFCTAS